MSTLEQQIAAKDERWSQEKKTLAQLLDKLSPGVPESELKGHISQSNLSELKALATFQRVSEILLLAAQAVTSLLGIHDCSNEQLFTELQSEILAVSASTESFKDAASKSKCHADYCGHKYTPEQLAMVYLILLEIQPCLLSVNFEKVFAAGNIRIEKDMDMSSESITRVLQCLKVVFLSFCRVHLAISYSLYNTQKGAQPDDWIIQRTCTITYETLNGLSIHLLALTQLDLVLKVLMPAVEAVAAVYELRTKAGLPKTQLDDILDGAILSDLTLPYADSLMRTLLYYFHYLRAKLYSDSFVPDKKGRRRPISWMFVELDIIASNLVQNGLAVANVDMKLLIDHADQSFSAITLSLIHQKIGIQTFLHCLFTAQINISQVKQAGNGSVLLFFAALVEFHTNRHIMEAHMQNPILATQPVVTEASVISSYDMLHKVTATHLLTTYLSIMMGFIEAFGVITCLSIESFAFNESTLENMAALIQETKISLPSGNSHEKRDVYPSSLATLFEYYRVHDEVLKPLLYDTNVDLATIRACDLMIDDVKNMQKLFSDLCDARHIRIQTPGSVLASAWVLAGELPIVSKSVLLMQHEQQKSALASSIASVQTQTPLISSVSGIINGAYVFMASNMQWSILESKPTELYKHYTAQLFETDGGSAKTTKLSFLVEPSAIISSDCERFFLTQYNLMQSEAITGILKSFSKNKDLYKFHLENKIGLADLIAILLGTTYAKGLSKLASMDADKSFGNLFTQIVTYDTSPLNSSVFVGLEVGSKPGIGIGASTGSGSIQLDKLGQLNQPKQSTLDDKRHNGGLMIFNTWIEQLTLIESYFRLLGMMSASSSLRTTFFNYITLSLKLYVRSLDVFCEKFEELYSPFAKDVYNDHMTSFSLPGTLKKDSYRLNKDTKKFEMLTGRQYIEHAHALIGTSKSIKQITSRYIDIMGVNESRQLSTLNYHVASVLRSCMRCASLCIFIHSINPVLIAMIDQDVLKKHYSAVSTKDLGTLAFPSNYNYIVQNFGDELEKQEITLGFVDFLDMWLLQYGVMAQLFRIRDIRTMADMVARIGSCVDEIKYAHRGMLKRCNVAVSICEKIVTSTKRYEGENFKDYCSQMWGIDVSCFAGNGDLLRDLFVSVYRCIDDKAKLQKMPSSRQIAQ